MNLIPTPKKYVKIVGAFSLSKDSKVYCDEGYKKYAGQFVDSVNSHSGMEVTFTDDIESAVIIFKRYEEICGERYLIMISQGTATVSFGTDAGCFYATQTLRQLFNVDFDDSDFTCDNCYIEDEPQFVYRGLSLDICRHFFPLETIKTIVELMSQVKLNNLHLHLSDDQGFRLQIDKYPLLNTVSCVRSGSEKISKGQRFVDDVPVEGYLTKNEIRELVAFAQERHVNIVPELDIPGHFVAVLAAYPEYGCAQTPLEVRKKWGISKDILCAGNPDSYKFVCDILDEICELFPSKLIHLGGDEAPKDRWCNCKLCREKLSELKLNNFDELQTHMTEQFRKYLEEKGRKVVCWNDGITHSTSEEIISQVWKPLTLKSGIKQANEGRKTILSPFFKMYFDYPYSMTPLSKTYKFKPLKGVRRKNYQNILGVEGAVWTEYIADSEKLFFNLLPRMDALAEVAWGYRKKDFNKRVQANRFAMYDKLGLAYNAKAVKRQRGRLSTTKKFFKFDSNVELDKSKSNQ